MLREWGRRLWPGKWAEEEGEVRVQLGEGNLNLKGETMAEIVGILEMAGRGGQVLPDGKRSVGLVAIAPADLNGAPFGMKVVVELLTPEDAVEPRGKVIEVLGDPARPDVAMEGIIRMHGLSQVFPPEVLAEAERVPSVLTDQMIASELAAGRQDLRGLKTITIDGLDARDLDDAISIERLDGGYRLWVHIADVSYYVTEGSALDREARERGNSVYLADRVLPMLPPALSNGICSLNPQVDRLAMTCSLDFDARGEVVDGDLFESLIRSDLRANYGDVWSSLEKQQPEPGYEDFMPELLLMQELASILEGRAEQRGALEFNFPETKIEMNADGTVKDIHAYPTSFANEIIEQFMIAANRFVGQKFREFKMPFLYRVHDYPDPEKLEKFRVLLRMQGKKIKISDQPTPKELAAILQSISEMPGSEALQSLLLRSLAKAAYSAEPIGHFGLALRDYSHFTSPIRRYPDLFIHRVIRGFLRDEVKIKTWTREAPDVAEHCSATERTAIAAERDSVDQKAAEYYAERLGEIYDGEITGFVGGGMFIMLPSTVEGMVPFRNLGDYYAYDEVTMTAIGRSKHRVFKIGDKMPVQIARVDVLKRQIDLSLVDERAAGRIDLDAVLSNSEGQAGRKGKKHGKGKASPSGKWQYSPSDFRSSKKKNKEKPKKLSSLDKKKGKKK